MKAYDVIEDDPDFSVLDPEVSNGFIWLERDVTSSAARLTQVCHGLAQQAGWWNDYQELPAWAEKLWVGTKLALVHSEISEALEGDRKDQMDDKLPHRKMLEVELADAVIRVFDLAGGLKLDLGGAIAEKLVYNSTREDHKISNRQQEGGKKY